MAIWRYNHDGSLDTSFNGVGYLTHDNAAGGASGNDRGESITLDSSGRILVAGHSNNGSNNDMAIWRYNSNGSLDALSNEVEDLTHGNAAGGNGNDEGKSITIDIWGRILVAGYSTGANIDMAIWRFL